MNILTLSELESLIITIFSEDAMPLSFLELVKKIRIKTKHYKLTDIKTATLNLIELDELMFTKNRKIQKKQ